MAKREGFVPIHHPGINGAAEIPEHTFPALEARGWKRGKAPKTSTPAPAADKKG